MASQYLAIPVHGLKGDRQRAAQIEQMLAQQPGVAYAFVNQAMEIAYVAYDPVICRPDCLASTIRRGGFGTGQLSVR
jgi:hypothetical protein